MNDLEFLDTLEEMGLLDESIFDELAELEDELRQTGFLQLPMEES